jgi:hypothetical protein
MNKPWFLWDVDVTEAEFRQALKHSDSAIRGQWQGGLLREARYAEIWSYVTLNEVVENWAEIVPHLGRRRAMWEWLLEGWRRDVVSHPHALSALQRTLSRVCVTPCRTSFSPAARYSSVSISAIDALMTSITSLRLAQTLRLPNVNREPSLHTSEQQSKQGLLRLTFDVSS